MQIGRAFFAAAAIATLLPLSAAAQPVTIKGPVAPSPVDAEGAAKEGTGLCIASAQSTTDGSEFPQQKAAYNAGINGFMETHAKDRIESVMRTVFDLSNNNELGAGKWSYGDFTDSFAPICKIGGCDFYWNDINTSFAVRMRGYLNVTEALSGKPIHIGFFVDDAVSLTFFNNENFASPVITRTPQLGVPTWRVTNTVTFEEPGLFPVEILYANFKDDAAVEMVYFDGTFTDQEGSAKDPASMNHKDAGFVLFEATQFFQTLSGVPSYPDLNDCKQCDRQFANIPGNHGCDPAYYCNEAALCAPCDTALFCGDTCAPCGGATPFCINVNGKKECGGCRDDFDCQAGFHCDPESHTCVDTCEKNSDCDQYEVCDLTSGECLPCDQPGGPDEARGCAGNSCNCCPKGQNGKQMMCKPLPSEKDGMPVCIECETNADCTEGVCDLLTGRCTDAIPENSSPTCCGENCSVCPADHPFCLPSSVVEGSPAACAQCRHDTDCAVFENGQIAGGKFCLSGECQDCVRDRRCGARCESCGGDTPYCVGQTPETAICVRCTNDSQCVGGKCNLKTYECEPTCPMTCAPETPHCDGQSCVACYADTQCPCGGICDLSTHSCVPQCRDNEDCLGSEHCRVKEDNESVRECAPGPSPSDAGCGSTLGSACSWSIGVRGEGPHTAGLVAFALLALLARRRELRGES